ncbi:MAG: hypothetical protein C4K48_05960 [Candidatus Thorarchaeota archaeon]|nr:MAG: hypothetical protein C4K48_05960 [Candidatus Thorarchaeota archaeon]
MWFIQALGWILLILGILCVIIALVLAVMKSESGEEPKMESRGVVLLGPIPIVWGYGRKGWLVAGIVGMILCLLWLLFFL